MTAPQGRGRPPVFDDNLREIYLEAVAQGMHLGEAAAHVHIHRNHPTRLARTNSAFAAALEEAKALGRKARQEDIPHDESRYKNYGCRCPTCTAAATAARTSRRHATQDDPGGQVYNLPPRPTPPILFAAEAS